MKLDTKMTVSLSQAKNNFSHVARIADKYGRVVILKDNEPKYLLVDLEQESLIYDLTDEEKLEIASKRILNQYKPAFEKFAKNWILNGSNSIDKSHSFKKAVALSIGLDLCSQGVGVDAVDDIFDTEPYG